MLISSGKMKQKQLAEKSTNIFWAYTIGEFILIILGILIALQIDNWNQNRQNRKLERVLLNEFLINLKSDLNDVEYNIRFNTMMLRSSDIIYNFLDGNESYQDSLEYHFGRLYGGTIFMDNISAYESLKSIGLDLISNDSLRRQITYLYSVSYDAISTLTDYTNRFLNQHLHSEITEYLKIVEIENAAKPLDLNEIRKSNSFKNNLKIHIFYLNHQIITYKRTKGLILNLIEGIEKELA